MRVLVIISMLAACGVLWASLSMAKHIRVARKHRRASAIPIRDDNGMVALSDPRSVGTVTVSSGPAARLPLAPAPPPPMPSDRSTMASASAQPGKVAKPASGGDIPSTRPPSKPMTENQANA